MNSVSSLAPNISTVAGLPEVNFHEGGSRVMIASRELSKRPRNLSSLSRSASSACLRSVMSAKKPTRHSRPPSKTIDVAVTSA